MPAPFLLLLLLPFSFSAAARAADARPSGELTGSMMQMLFGLALVIAVLLATLWLIRRLSAPRGSAAAAVKVLAATALGPRERLVLVRIGEEVLVLGVAPGRVSTLHRISAAEFAHIEAEQDKKPGSTGASFAGWLKEAMERRNAR